MKNLHFPSLDKAIHFTFTLSHGDNNHIIVAALLILNISFTVINQYERYISRAVWKVNFSSTISLTCTTSIAMCPPSKIHIATPVSRNRKKINIIYLSFWPLLCTTPLLMAEFWNNCPFGSHVFFTDYRGREILIKAWSKGKNNQVSPSWP